ncbi:MAG: gamma-glutamyl-gamma-aminobutyrate hydrolase family protein [Lentisphaeria bacterium]|nr:gamma-glutamyl-gamma-aminobutyrate hydrolase family protein [Lentisphaeria bacterium]
MKKRPLIAVNMSMTVLNSREIHYLIDSYAERIWAAGGDPYLLPSLLHEGYSREILSKVQGVLLSGGKDYPPSFYGQEPVPETDLTRLRPSFDICFGKEALAGSLPILGICAGFQLLNILHGGKLLQHLPNADEAHKGGLMHSAKITQEGWMSRILSLKKGENFTVNSFHHQAVTKEYLGKDLFISSLAFDGTVESIERPGERMVLGVQFHPERMDDIGPLYFSALVEEASKTTL